MSFFAPGQKITTQQTTVQNRQAAVQGGGNVVLTGGQISGGRDVIFNSLDPEAVSSMERLATAAVGASQKYVEFASASNINALNTNRAVAETYAEVARDVAGTGMTAEQIAAARGGITNQGLQISQVLPILAVVGIGLAVWVAYKKLR